MLPSSVSGRSTTSNRCRHHTDAHAGITFSWQVVCASFLHSKFKKVQSWAIITFVKREGRKDSAIALCPKPFQLCAFALLFRAYEDKNQNHLLKFVIVVVVFVLFVRCSIHCHGSLPIVANCENAVLLDSVFFYFVLSWSSAFSFSIVDVVRSFLREQLLPAIRGCFLSNSFFCSATFFSLALVLCVSFRLSSLRSSCRLSFYISDIRTIFLFHFCLVCSSKVIIGTLSRNQKRRRAWRNRANHQCVLENQFL